MTIVIPTYNRAECLSLLLRTLVAELTGLEHLVRVVVADNASTDDTPAVVEAFQHALPFSIHALRHDRNVGAEENFCRGIEAVRSRHVWIVGDDDLPKTGVLSKILALLQDQPVDLLYLRSEWLPQVGGASDGEAVTQLSVSKLGKREFAAQVNIWVTFISGMVFNLERVRQLEPGIDIRRFSGTSLVQLGWVLPLLNRGAHFRLVRERCVLATSGNTGGYKLITAFATNLPAVTAAVCGRDSPILHSIMQELTWSYLPSLLWMNRFKNPGTFEVDDIAKALQPLKRRLAYWLLILPVVTLPKLLAGSFLVGSKVYTKLRTLVLRRRLTLKGQPVAMTSAAPLAARRTADESASVVET